jgi:hypothetical protein
MSFRNTVGVCSENHTKHLNAIYGQTTVILKFQQTVHEAASIPQMVALISIPISVQEPDKFRLMNGQVSIAGLASTVILAIGGGGGGG